MKFFVKWLTSSNVIITKIKKYKIYHTYHGMTVNLLFFIFFFSTYTLVQVLFCAWLFFFLTFVLYPYSMQWRTATADIHKFPNCRKGKIWKQTRINQYPRMDPHYHHHDLPWSLMVLWWDQSRVKKKYMCHKMCAWVQKQSPVPKPQWHCETWTELPLTQDLPCVRWWNTRGWK